MSKYKAKVMCHFEIEVEDEGDIELAKENIKLSNIGELLDNETDDSIEIINVTNIKEC